LRIRIRDPDHFSWSLETIFWVKIPKFFDADPGWKNSDPGWKKVGSGINIPDPQHWLRQLSGLESRHLSTIQNGDKNAKGVDNTL
jgi:hypothetical protein